MTKAMVNQIDKKVNGNETIWFDEFPQIIRFDVVNMVIEKYCATRRVRLHSRADGSNDDKWDEVYETFDDLALGTIIGNGAGFSGWVKDAMLHIYIYD